MSPVEQPTKALRADDRAPQVVLMLLCSLSADVRGGQEHLHAIPRVLIHQRLVLAWIALAVPDDHPHVERQGILFSDEHRFEFLLHENVLRTRFGSAKMMRAQIDRLRSLTTLSNVVIRVIPWQKLLPAVPLIGFTIFDEAVVRMELPSTRGEIRRPRDVATYVGDYDAFATVALDESGTLALLAALDDEYQDLDE